MRMLSWLCCGLANLFQSFSTSRSNLETGQYYPVSTEEHEISESLTFPVQCTEGQDVDQRYFARLYEPGRESGLRQITEGLNGSRGSRLVMRRNEQRFRSLIGETNTEQYQSGRLHHGNVTLHGPIHCTEDDEMKTKFGRGTLKLKVQVEVIPDRD